MSTDLDLDLEVIEGETEEKLKVKNRFEKLAEKVILTSKEKEEAEARAKAEMERAATLEKERNFYKGLSSNITKYPQAVEYQDKILEKVKSGYSPDDAIVAVLNAEGKLFPQAQQSQQAQQATQSQQTLPSQTVEGGSAPTTAFTGEKGLQDMSPSEKLQALMEAEKSGSLVNALRGN